VWLWLGFRRERSRVDRETAGFVRLNLRERAEQGGGEERFRSGRRRCWLRGRGGGSRAGFALGMKAGQGEQLVPSPFYVCEGGQLGLS
jgi:hypothetical protein